MSHTTSKNLRSLIGARTPQPNIVIIRRNIVNTAFRAAVARTPPPSFQTTVASTISTSALRRLTPVPRTRLPSHQQQKRAFTPGVEERETKKWDFEAVSQEIQNPKTKIIFVDTREPGELASTGKIPGAINIPITSNPDSFNLAPEDFEDRYGFAPPDKEAEVVFYCKAGVRAHAAAELAKRAGWIKVGEYPGSWLEGGG